MKLCGFKIKKFLIFLIFSEKKVALIFQQTKTPEKFLIFTQKKACLIFQETQTPKKLLYISENKTFLYTSSKKKQKTKNKKKRKNPLLKSFLYSGSRTFYFQAKNQKKKKIKILCFSKKGSPDILG